MFGAAAFVRKIALKQEFHEKEIWRCITDQVYDKKEELQALPQPEQILCAMQASV